MAMGQLRQGKDLIKRSAEPGGNRKGSTAYTPYISWKTDESKNIFFVLCNVLKLIYFLRSNVSPRIRSSFMPSSLSLGKKTFLDRKSVV